MKKTAPKRKSASPEERARALTQARRDAAEPRDLARFARRLESIYEDAVVFSDAYTWTPHLAEILFVTVTALKRKNTGALGSLRSGARTAAKKLSLAVTPAEGRWEDKTEHQAAVKALCAREIKRGVSPRALALLLSRALADGPLRHLYASAFTAQRDGDAERIVKFWERKGSFHCDAKGGKIERNSDPERVLVHALEALDVESGKAHATFEAERKRAKR